MLAPVALVTRPRSCTMNFHQFLQFQNRLIDPTAEVVLNVGACTAS